MKKPGKVGRSTNNNLPPQSQAGDDDDEINSKNNNKKLSNKSFCCPFACPNCQSLGGDLVKSKYEIGNILTDDSDSIFSPMHEKYKNEDHGLPTRSGQVFIAADLLEKIDDKVDLLQKSQALLRKDLVSAGVLKAA